ncbi:MAG: 30S ribosomal protein S16 [Patescibacteria group bacterium]|nr:30S ribosomal protein S16 [Patescibacteria group bacterium]
MLIIRFQKIGKKKQKIMRLVLQEKRSKLNGKVIKILGWWDPFLDKGNFDSDLIKFYIDNGSQLSQTAKQILAKNKII